jgi:hypothetical protein
MNWKDPSWKTAACEYHQARGDRRAVVELDREKLQQLRRLLNVLLERA